MRNEPLSTVMTPTTEYPLNHQSDDDGGQFNILEDLKSFHARNMTGKIGDSQWHEDINVHELWEKLSVPEPNDVSSLQSSVVRHIITTLARTHFNADDFAGYQAAAHSVRDRLISNWNETQQHHTRVDQKRVYYLSLEFLMGRSLNNAILNMNLKGNYADALKGLGMNLENAIGEEVDAALGNGGLGRLAACFMDSLATMNYPAWGYGLRYTYGIFQQQIVNGYQVEFPDYWLNFGNPWEVPRLDVVYEVRFYGEVTRVVDPITGQARAIWQGGEKVEAVAYDVPIPGYGTKNTINIRLWSSKPKKKFNLQSFNDGDYQKSVDDQQRAENITSVLYPNDNTIAGKELRLKQQYFFVCATLQDIIRRFKKTSRPWSEFPDQVAIQLNDTHPTLGIPELIRILIDIEKLTWDAAWDIVTRVYSFTNHTVLPEATEKWPVSLVQNLLPRHMQIIYDINLFFLQKVESAFSGDRSILASLSIIEESPYQQVRMAHLAIVGSHTVNGVAAIHSALIKETIFKDFVRFYGEDKFQNKTNGITPRRWLNQANPLLSELITNKLGNDDWILNLSELKKLETFADDDEFANAWMSVKAANKTKLATLIAERCKISVDPTALFDVQVKRIHEYKRQFMNILQVIYRYMTLKSMSQEQLVTAVPRVIIFGGKAAPGYYIAKLVIKLINNVAEIVNADVQTSKYLKIVFIPDYNVSNAEVIVPASDISEHISTAGTEASGTSNMKFVLNGGLIIGTLDGANVEIKEEVGDENIFIFGCLAHQVEDLRHAQRYRRSTVDPKLETVLEAVRSGHFGDYESMSALFETLSSGGDHYLISSDFSSYLEAQSRVDEAFKDKRRWATMSIKAAARMGKFSSDRSIEEYAEQIWKIKPCIVP